MIYIYGAGEGGEKCLKYYRFSEEVLGFIDSDIGKIGSFFWGKPVFSINDVPKKGVNIIVASSYYSEIVKDLALKGFERDSIRIFPAVL